MTTTRLDPTTRLAIDGDRLAHDLATLATWSDAAPPAVTRVVYTPADLAARAFVRDGCTAAGLAVRVDALGNTFARWAGSAPELPAVATGSHIDAIPGAGRFDGTVGVLGAIEAVRALQRVGFTPTRSIEIILFTSEEPTRFGIGCLGSRALAGVLAAEALSRLHDGDGRTLDEVRREAGFTGDLASVRLEPGHFAAFVELHIEQGPRLEAAGRPIGLVTAIAAPAALRVVLSGQGGHAGTVLMPERHDALCGAAAVVLAVEAAARASGRPDTVATTGVCRVEPGAVNGIPARVTLEIDVRDIDAAPRDAALAAIVAAATEIAAARGLTIDLTPLNQDPPARADPAVMAAIAAACAAEACDPLPMVSRAYHDALFLARIAPIGMIFVPSQGGHSHRPEEFTATAEIAQGVAVLARTLAELAQGDP